MATRKAKQARQSQGSKAKKAAPRKRVTSRKAAPKKKAVPKKKKKKAKARKPAAAARATAGRRKAAPPAPPPTVRRRTTPLSDYWRKLVDSGWLDEVPENEHRGLRERLTAALAASPATAYEALAVTSLDLECIEGAGPDEVCSYHSVLRQLADASFGRFQPEDILDELDPALEVARISFCLGELAFHCEVPFRDDWVQPGVLDLVNRALETIGVAVRFQPLPADSQILSLAFVSPPVFRRARELGLIPAAPPELSAPPAPPLDVAADAEAPTGAAPDAG